ncbi:Glycoside hydrolase superfamily [Penicillium cf. griseofulvum]|nr:Glycoside hydrolase superfamily [Penicillium cf. griseofulvum]
MFKRLALGLLAVQAVAATRFAMYIDEWHVTALPGKDKTEGVDYAIMSFAASKLFNSDPPEAYKPFEAPATMRNRFSPNTKLMVAIGGWGDTAGFSEGAKDEASRTRYAKNVAAMLDAHGFDGVDIDWEYPGGNGQDYKDIPNSKKVAEIETYPLFLEAIRKAIGNKILSIAVPGRKQDFIAFTKEQGPKIFKSVDIINVMSYDLTNRRDNVTNHHSGVQVSLDTINEYLAIGATPEKINLGFAYYAKWFTTDPNSDCNENPLGCHLAKLENDDGSDNGKSGVLTFEASTMSPAPKDLKEGSTGVCGFAAKAKCPSGSCCSSSGYCGTSDQFCQAGCLSEYGTCKGVSITDSWRKAQKDGKTDAKGGGQYYFDSDSHIFWTWDTPEMIARKFTEIVAAKKLGGIMAWSLGEDTYKFEHLAAMQKGLKSHPAKVDAPPQGCDIPKA